MKKLFLFLFGFLISVSTMAEGPAFKHKDTFVNQEFDNVYSDLRKKISAPINESSGTIRSFTATSASITYATIGNILSNVAMNSNKLTGLAAGTANGDSVRFEQLKPGKILQVVVSTNSSITQRTSTSGSYASTGLAVTITPTLNTSTILVLAIQNFGVSGTAATVCTARILRNTTAVIPLSDYHIAINDSTTEFDIGSSLIGYDSPGTASAIQYQVSFARSAGTGTCIANTTTGSVGGNGGYMIILEIGQ